jgi:Zn-dependent protease
VTLPGGGAAGGSAGDLSERVGASASSSAQGQVDLTDSVRPSPIFLVLVGLFLAACVWASQVDGIGPARWAVRAVVFTGWVLSLCLHEFGHAATAFKGGDVTVVDKGYLTLDPRKYAHVGLSLGLPVLFLLLGGIGLPGGAVWINTGMIRTRAMRSLMSFAGPAANLLTAVVLAIPLALGLFDSMPALGLGLAFLASLQVSTALLNLLPIPGLDGFGVLTPYLPASVLQASRQFSQFGFIILFVLLMNTGLGTALWDTSNWIADAIGVPLQWAELGRALFSF